MTKQITIPMNENALSKWQRVPKDMQEKAIEASLMLLWRDDVFFHTFFEGKIEKDEIRIPLFHNEDIVNSCNAEEDNKPEFNF
ncbi:hypothetical protein [Campylobacter helveticus]|uniref:hypothetical protein n=1 Tax=Campylobacter helveticus TaxID=28898 RepID=UPI001049E289|nr:hypothetical protein [Campylobacter helveticus]MCR2060664.1 hypothetical protein [Campylobacter helveticus]MCR2067038.1 hypothetical protein [Campylobacter helveticus]QBL11264.1 hypothetical protein A0073_01575 [Campylobacter helveticus]